MAFLRRKKTGTLDDVAEAAGPVGATGDRAVQDEYLPALDEALDSLPKKERQKAGSTIVQLMIAAEAKHLDSRTHEGFDLTVSKFQLMIDKALNLRQLRLTPAQFLGHYSATQIAKTLRSISDAYADVYLEEHGTEPAED